jgi:hypothetical protein
MITFQTESPEPFTQEALALFKEHYNEIAERKDVIKLDPNLENYNTLYEKNALEIHTIRENEKLIGYSLWFLTKHIHYKNSLTANSDVLYISPDHRKGMTGVKFIKWSIEQIKKRKPQRLMFHVKPFLDYSPILERFGANEFETIYTIVQE